MKIKYLPLQPHCFAFGGFDIQMLATLEAVRSLEVDSSTLDIWSRDSSFHILHCWGLGYSNLENFTWAKKAGKQLVATILMFDPDSLKQKFRLRLSAAIGRQRILKEMLELPDKVVVVNENQADICNFYYKVNAGKIDIVPNVVHESFFNAAAAPVPTNGYVLTVGNICRRKNQVMLAEACIRENVPLYIVGKILNGEEQYGHQLKLLADAHEEIHLVGELKENSDELVNYYRNCSLYALPSYVEQQPISLLEAAVMRKPLLAANRSYAKQSYYRNIRLVNPADVTDIQRGIREIRSSPAAYVPSVDVLEGCKASAVGLSYKKIYESLTNGI